MSEQPLPEPAPAEVPPTAVPRGSRASIPTSTIVVGAILIAVLAFGVGFLVGHRTGRHAFPFARYGHMGAIPWTRSGVMPGAGMPGMGGGSGYGGISGGMSGIPSTDRILAGTVTSVSGDSFTVRTLRGDAVTVVTSGSTIVRSAAGTTGATVRPGARVLVAGVPQADGSIAATHVLEGLVGWEASPLPGTPTSSADG